MATALASSYAASPWRTTWGMTGEITLTGQVLPVGGIREKVLAAQRAGLKRVILPRENEHDLDDLPPETREELEFVSSTGSEEVARARVRGRRILDRRPARTRARQRPLAERALPSVCDTPLGARLRGDSTISKG